MGGRQCKPSCKIGGDIMRHALMIAAALSLLTVAGTPAFAQKLDANGKCHGADGKFAKAEVCKGGSMMGPKYKADAKGKCHGPDGKFAKQALCK
jgi:hypothetical protein